MHGDQQRSMGSMGINVNRWGINGGRAHDEAVASTMRPSCNSSNIKHLFVYAMHFFSFQSSFHLKTEEKEKWMSEYIIGNNKVILRRSKR